MFFRQGLCAGHFSSIGDHGIGSCNCRIDPVSVLQGPVEQKVCTEINRQSEHRRPACLQLRRGHLFPFEPSVQSIARGASCRVAYLIFNFPNSFGCPSCCLAHLRPRDQSVYSLHPSLLPDLSDLACPHFFPPIKVVIYPQVLYTGSKGHDQDILDTIFGQTVEFFLAMLRLDRVVYGSFERSLFRQKAHPCHPHLG